MRQRRWRACDWLASTLPSREQQGHRTEQNLVDERNQIRDQQIGDEDCRGNQKQVTESELRKEGEDKRGHQELHD